MSLQAEHFHPYAKRLLQKHTQNMQHHLLDRESGLSRYNYTRHPRPPWHLSYERQFYKSITPNLTVQNVDRPVGFIRKFTPDGQLLLCFSQDQRALAVHKYRGVGAALDLLNRYTGECITAADDSEESLHIRQQIFQRLFRLQYVVSVKPDSATSQLNREFSIFLEGGRYVLLVTVSIGTEMPQSYVRTYPDLWDDCELYNYTFFLICLRAGTIKDKAKYNKDNILLSHNHGVSVHGYTIAILSKCRQCIEVLELANERLMKLDTIGAYEELNDEGPQPADFEPHFTFITRNPPISPLKQRILSFMYRKICSGDRTAVRQGKLKEFYKNFGIYERMIMAKMQLIDSDHLLIRYEDRCYSTVDEIERNQSDFKLYVFYAFTEKQVLAVFPNNSRHMLHLLRSFCDSFRNVRSLQTQRTSSSPSNNVFFNAAFQNAINSLSGGYREAALLFNPTLPISCQSFSTCQYLDYGLFNYDDRLVSAWERPKICNTEPIRFNDRHTNTTKFRLFLEPPSATVPNSNSGQPTASDRRELVAFVFHPYEPFALSIQKLSTRYVLNFHIYNPFTEVKQ